MLNQNSIVAGWIGLTAIFLAGPSLPANPPRSSQASANIAEFDFKTLAKRYAETHVRPFLQDDESLIAELEQINQSRRHWKPYRHRWKAWRPDEVELNRESYDYAEYVWSARKDREFRNAHTRSSAAETLHQFSQSSNGLILELFVVDARGGNVAVASWTSDWFQGDEPKFKKAAQSGQIEVSQLSRDNTVGRVVVQISIPLFDRDGGFAGVAIVSLDAERLTQR
ncbi:PDC sensor domain-containing protein [Roseiconus lacunae]|uniref:PDC sensor domain-containing protein n=1 Tax=Roseiconus lacunae TaxID=2605694 RepID=A0ABT7PF80_9BACT|nr:PDC sensor domain-containing protein [Roseiconus lacunae]MCD0458732.1 PDC sensor domain-containing protein [Roseiconus lacunae]MDM4015023.1 PDC sensor domain-containing protein [Roseiconus lacunae]WRQ50203.1 PDC sensor domain-containing protein [Stieleria sp. HD01]